MNKHLIVPAFARLLALLCCIAHTSLKAQNYAAANAPVSTVLLRGVNAQLTFPGGKWKLIDSAETGPAGKSFAYVKDPQPGSDETDLYAVVHTGQKDNSPMQSVEIILGEALGNTFGGGYEKRQKMEVLKSVLGATYNVTDVSAGISPLLSQDFKNVIALELIAKQASLSGNFFQSPSGYLVEFSKENILVSIYLSSSHKEFQNNKPEMLTILKSVSAINNKEMPPAAAPLKSNAKLPADVVSEFLPICDGYSYTYIEHDPVFGKVIHTKSYEKAPGKTVNGKQFKGFLVRCTNPFLNGRYEYYNFENGILTIHKENEAFTTTSYEEYNVFNPVERRTSYETGLEGKNTFTTSVVLKTNIPVGGSWSEKVVDGGYTSTNKYTILEKGVSIDAGDNNYANVVVVGKQVDATIVSTGAKVSMNIKMYFAKGIGLVKTAVQNGSEAPTETIMDTYTFP